MRKGKPNQIKKEKWEKDSEETRENTNFSRNRLKSWYDSQHSSLKPLDNTLLS